MMDVLWIVVGFVAVLWIWPVAWKAGIDGKVECLIEFSRHECDIGEALPFTVTLVNRSHFPIPYAEIQLTLPEQLSFHETDKRSKLSFATYVLMRRRVSVQFTLYGYSRGPSTLRDVSIRLHEGFGMRNVYLSGRASSVVAVRPKALPMRRFAMTRSIQGEQPVDQPMYPDETLLKGVRPYQFRDPARHIHWRASARLGQIVSKEFFSSTEPRVLLIVNAQFSEPHWLTSGHPAFDTLCAHALHTAIDFERQGAQVQFATNAACGINRKFVLNALSPSRISSLLGHAHAIAATPLSDILDAISHPSKANLSLVILFSQFETPEQQRRLDQLRRRGVRVERIRVEGETP